MKNNLPNPLQHGGHTSAECPCFKNTLALEANDCVTSLIEAHNKKMQCFISES